MKRNIITSYVKEILIAIIVIGVLAVTVIKAKGIIANDNIRHEQQIMDDSDRITQPEFRDSLFLNSITPCETEDREKFLRFMEAIVTIESKWNGKAYNPHEQALGWMQIRPILVRDINRKDGVNFKLQDRKSLSDNIKMFTEYARMYQQSSLEKNNFKRLSRLWNGGPNGHRIPATIGYWNRVNNVYKSLAKVSFNELRIFKQLKGNI